MYLSALIPNFRLSHCPYERISNMKPAHASDNIYTHYGHDNPRIYISTESTPGIYTQRACTLVGCTPYYIYKGE